MCGDNGWTNRRQCHLQRFAVGISLQATVGKNQYVLRHTLTLTISMPSIKISLIVDLSKGPHSQLTFRNAKLGVW